MNSVKRYNELVTELLLNHKELNIAAVNNFERVKSLFLDPAKYPFIVLLIKKKNGTT
jgi:hypothetical protein